MCLIAFQWDPMGPAPLQVAANRDEFYARPTAPLAWWEGGEVLAGRDLEAGGTWLGVSRGGRFAALTNHRNPALVRPEAPSRGQLPAAFLEGRGAAEAFLADLAARAGSFNPFNLLLFDGRELWGFESVTGRSIAFTPGLHAVSNGAFDEPWPKVEVLKAGVMGAWADGERLLQILEDGTGHPDAALPATGVSRELERTLSPIFIRTPTYGTRSSTLVTLGRDRGTVTEQTHTPAGRGGRVRVAFSHEGKD